MDSTAPPQPVPDERGSFIVIGGSSYVAYAIHGCPAYLTRATRNPDRSITLHPVGTPHARLDLAADAGRWRCERETHAAAIEDDGARCGTPLTTAEGGPSSARQTRTPAALTTTNPASAPPPPSTPAQAASRSLSDSGTEAIMNGRVLPEARNRRER